MHLYKKNCKDINDNDKCNDDLIFDKGNKDIRYVVVNIM